MIRFSEISRVKVLLIILGAAITGATGAFLYLDKQVGGPVSILNDTKKKEPPKMILVTSFNKEVNLSSEDYGKILNETAAEKPREGTYGKIAIDDIDPRLKPVFKDGINPLVKDSVSFIAVGDIMLSRGVEYQLARKKDYSASFRKVADKLKSYDITFGNLETAVSSRYKSTSTGMAFSSDPRTIEGMKLAGFDALSLANNHATNFGLNAFTDTLKNFTGSGIALFGGGNSQSESRKCADFAVKETKICLLGYNTISGSIEAREDYPGVVYIHAAPFSPFDQADLDRALGDVKREKAAGKFVIVFPHWGVEYTHKPIADQIKIGHAFIDAGADAVIGTHAHWVQGAEFYKGKPIAYSLGNFIFDQGIGDYERQVVQGVALEGLVRNGKLVYIKFLPLHIYNQLYPEFLAAGSNEAGQILNDVSAYSLSPEFK